MILETIENSIIDKLKETFEDFDIESFPIDFENYEFTSPVGCILVRYENSDFSNQETLTAVNSKETFNFTVFAAFRYCRTHSDTYVKQRILKRTLNGLSIMNKRLRVKKINFETEISGDLWYSFQTQIELSNIDEYKDESAANQLII